MNTSIAIPFALLLLVLGLSHVNVALAFDAKIADRIFVNAKAYTANPAQPFSEAVAIKDQTILFVGSDNDAAEFMGDATETIDLKGKLLLPGFIDIHNHIFEAASDAGGNCELSA